MDSNLKETLVAQIEDYAVFYGLYRVALEEGRESWRILKEIHEEKLHKISSLLDDIDVQTAEQQLQDRYAQILADVQHEFDTKRANDEEFANDWPADTFDSWFDQYKFDRINAAIVERYHQSVDKP